MEPDPNFWSCRTVLVTGISGFVGSHLSEKLLALGADVHGIIRRRSSMQNIAAVKDELNLHPGDVSDAHSTVSILKEVQPSVVFHLAAQSFVPLSWQAPLETISSNITGTLNVLEAIRKIDTVDRIHFAGSSEEYGAVRPNESPVKETNELRPLSPYGVSKVACDMMCFQYAHSYKIPVIRTRAFNHTGPRRGQEFVTSNFANQIANILKGKQPPVIKVGNLEAVRDFTDVRDMIRAYMLAVEKCDVNEIYNIGSGKGWKIREMLDLLIRLSGAKIKTEQDPERMRPSDVEHLICDSTKFRKKTGWAPNIPFDRTMGDLLDYWKARV